MARKRAAKTANPPPVAPTSHTQEAQIEALATFLNTASPLREPIQSTGSQATMPTSSYQGLPGVTYSLRSKEDRVGNRIQIDGLHNSGQDMESLLRELEGEEERLWKRIGVNSKEILLATAAGSYGPNSKARMLLRELEREKGFEKHHNQFRDSVILNDLKESIGALTGHIFNDDLDKLNSKLQSITEQMKATPLHTKVLLNHPDGSPNENAFEQEAAVQKMMQEISDLKTNVKVWENTVNKAKELTNDAQNPVNDAKEPTKEKSGERNLSQAERKQSAINRYMQKFNINEATARQRWLRVHQTRLLEADIMAQTCDEVEEGTNVAVPKTEPLRIRSGQSYESMSAPPMDTQGRELTTNANHSSPQARDATTDAISAPSEPDVKTELGVKTEKEQLATQDLGASGGENMMTVDTAPLPTAKPVMYADVSHPESNMDLWIALWGGNKDAWVPLRKYLMEFSQPTRDDAWETHMDWLTRAICDPAAPGRLDPSTGGGTTVGQLDQFSTTLDSVKLFKKLEVIQRLNGGGIIPRDRVRPVPILDAQEDTEYEDDQQRVLAEKAELQRLQLIKLEDREKEHQKTKEKLELLERYFMQREETLRDREQQLRKREEQLKKPGHQSQECKMQQKEIERLLKLREEHLHKREEQRLEVDGLLQKLEEQLQEREVRLVDRERSLHTREAEWEKHQEQRLEIEKLLQQREEQLQKRDDQLQTREGMLQTREDQSLNRDDKLERREDAMYDRERAAKAKLTSANEQVTKMQAEIEKGEAQLAQRTNTCEEAKREISLGEMDLAMRTHALKHRVEAVASREECLEQLRMNVHGHLKVLGAGSAKPCTSWAGSTTGYWQSVLELATQVRVFVEAKLLEWDPNETQLAGLKKMAVDVEEETKKVIFGGEIKLEDCKKIAAALGVDDNKGTPVLMEAKENVAATEQWNGWSEDFSTATSTENGKPAEWNNFAAKKFPAPTVVKYCSDRWGCVCTSRPEQDEIWGACKPSSNNDGAEKGCKCNNWGLGCDRRPGCEDSDVFPPLSINRPKDTSDW
ncbi:hypothetical protein V500_04942 [Pseudogymnoascus sp. VKM F-4518 (FW-2643)]|nr:hypothetical protein V500_04942 [Pseudogymnoascus sp. VKM F-4518 (FW-2643)]